eukprot:GHVR01130751.1.p1 GENE.GHVR01130751.1~~GHVR01130751.1.p1  ORF type:complete len:125 (-),score=30.79 GHVR01130751.1:23-397(-)
MRNIFIILLYLCWNSSQSQLPIERQHEKNKNKNNINNNKIISEHTKNTKIYNRVKHNQFIPPPSIDHMSLSSRQIPISMYTSGRQKMTISMLKSDRQKHKYDYINDNRINKNNTINKKLKKKKK